MGHFTAADVPDQSGRTILITGANSGIGYEAAKVLAGQGAYVFMGCRDHSRAEKAIQSIRREHPNALLGVVELDLGSLSSIRRAAVKVQQEKRLDMLINNAGVMRPPLRHTDDGFELQFGVNHLGHFALTSLLLGKLAGGNDPRVVTVASIAHKRGDIHFDDLDGSKGYDKGKFYSQSKLANLLFMAELDRRLRAAGSPIKSVACHPGISGTELGRNSWLENLAMKAASIIFHRPDKAALPTLKAAIGEDVSGGDYFGPQGLIEGRGEVGHAIRTKKAKDADLARRLWDVSIAMTDVDPGLSAA